ncbi:chitin synthase chs-2-like [Ischnura elegans]|uniref:chitin synthase chs-2-like n=1 Tax=Ischnura elegans TaxID=197161 RepID=UPI001ED8B2C9|nr:chitin synthase chs-2-like [Ischnura elegans]
MARRPSTMIFGNTLDDVDEEDEEYSDDESTSLMQEDTTAEGSHVKGWDVFENLPPEEDSGSNAEHKWIEVSMKIMKVLSYFVTFSMVLGCGVLAKGSLLLMASQIKPGKVTEYCNLELGPEKHFTSTIPEAEQVAWTWLLLIAVITPELGSFMRSIRICLFKFWDSPPLPYFLFVAGMETLNAIGTSLLVFTILPNLDSLRGAMLTNCVCFIPAILGFLSRNEDNQRESKGPSISKTDETQDKTASFEEFFNSEKSFLEVIRGLSRKGWIMYGVDFFAIFCQGMGLILWAFVEGIDNPRLWAIPFALLFISAGWWENYISKYSPFPFMKAISKVKDNLKTTRYFIYSFVSAWKIVVIFVVCLLSQHFNGMSVKNFFTKVEEGFSDHQVSVSQVQTVYNSQSGNLPDISAAVPIGESIGVNVSFLPPILVCIVQIVSAYFCYIFGKFACKICIQEFSFAFPVNLTVPVTVTVLTLLCTNKATDACYYHGTLPDYLFFDSPSMYMLTQYISEKHVWVWVFWLISQSWITIHIWAPKCDRVASTDKLFVIPLYSSVVLDQSLALNRRQDDQPDLLSEELDDFLETSDKPDSGRMTDNQVKASDCIPRIYACATMWHETREEMIEMLKSIMRLDADQSARHNAQQYFRVVDPDYYKLEIHVFFDDAYELTDDEDEEKVVNQFVKLLVATIDEAASHVHETHVKVRPPKKYPTPYGGRLVWVLPGKNKMIAHLKDKTKIRQKKRWSQVMYMYYLLGHRLIDLPMPTACKEMRAENTFILALDGDIDFQPQAVQLLVDLMKKNRNLGAACGRIHPVGSGPMVWYQKFEYAVGHWLQKATEHTIGSVLCSPGCFSLFRGKALMDDNVMRRYTTRAYEARHYVQYDQGEDRWLCTLLLQRGHHVEYSAASDAYTHCPEGFNEFYNQRRRWVPSTMANIFDLLGDYKRTVECNANISTLYIVYQMVLMAGTVLGPGTIFLMLVGAFVAAFKIDNWTSFYYNLIPIMIYMFVCFLCKSDVQLWTALLISTVYGLVMIAVLVGIMMQIAEDGPLAPSSLFLFIVASEFIVTAILHPKEIGCLPHGITYYITVPSMYLLLIIYSVFNMNNVSWGTREIISRRRRQEMEEEKKKKAEEALKNKGKKKSLLGFLGPAGGDDAGSMEFSFAGLFKCMLCTHKDDSKAEEKRSLLQITESLERLGKRMENIERCIDPRGMTSGRRRSVISSAGSNFLGTLAEEDANDVDDEISDRSDSGSMISEPKIERDDLVNPYWIEDPDLKNGDVEILSRDEMVFWKDLIDKYLYPIAESDDEKKKIANDLKQLRDKSVFAFFMLNAFFVVIVFLLQLHRDLLHVTWPLGVKNNITYVATAHEIIITKKYLQLEPIGLIFVFFFGIILIIQFVAMLIHRLGTFSHILASTELSCYCNKKVANVNDEEMSSKEAVSVIREFMRVKDSDRDLDYDSKKAKKERRMDRYNAGQRTTVEKLERKKSKQTHQSISLTSVLRERLNSIRPDTIESMSSRLSVRRSTLRGIQRAQSVIREETERRRSLTGGYPRRRSSQTGNSFSDISTMSLEENSEEKSFRNNLRNAQESPVFARRQTPRKSVQFKENADLGSDV